MRSPRRFGRSTRPLPACAISAMSSGATSQRFLSGTARHIRWICDAQRPPTTRAPSLGSRLFSLGLLLDRHARAQLREYLAASCVVASRFWHLRYLRPRLSMFTCPWALARARSSLVLRSPAALSTSRPSIDGDPTSKADSMACQMADSNGPWAPPPPPRYDLAADQYARARSREADGVWRTRNSNRCRGTQLKILPRRNSRATLRSSHSR